jgi:hypothetical protein
VSLQSIYADIYASHGRLDPDEIEAEARDDAHPLHPYLEWDDTEAGIKYRRLQIQKHLREISIEREVFTPIPRAVMVRAFHSTRDDRRYVPLDVVEADPALMEDILERMKADIADLRRKYRAHEQVFASVVQQEFALTA